MYMYRMDVSPNWKCICINFQCGVPASRCIYLSLKSPADDWTDRHKITKGPRTTKRTDARMDFNPWPAAACSVRNYELRK